MIEHHAHIAAFGRQLTLPDLAGCRSVRECLDMIAAERRRLDATDSPSWTLALRARPSGWTEERWPTRRELDDVTGDRPTFISSFDHHSGMANSAALRAASIHAATPDPAKGVIVRDMNREPTGVLLEAATSLIYSRLPEPGALECREHVRRAIEALHVLGYREIHDMLAQPWLGSVLADFDDAGQLACAVRLYAPVEQIEGFAANASSWQRPRVSLGGGKIFVDGTLSSRTAWVLEPFADPQVGTDGVMTHGLPNWSAADLDNAVRRTDALGLPMAAHAIGDAAVRAMLDSIERVKPRSSGYRIEHCELIDEADVPRFAKLRVCASVQPCHLLSDIEVLMRAVPDRLSRVMPWRELIDSGCEPGHGIVFGSDVPIVDADPEDSIVAATLRRRADMPAGDAIAPEQAITREESREALGERR